MTTKKTKGAPGTWLKLSAERYRAVHIILKHAHVLQIIDDHQLMWHEAAGDTEREYVRARLRRQLMLAGTNVIGFEVASHGAWAFFSNPMLGGALLVLGSAIVYLTDRTH